MVISDSDDEPIPKPSASSVLKRKKTTALISSDEESEAENPPPRKKPTVSPSKYVNGTEKSKSVAKKPKAPPKAPPKTKEEKEKPDVNGKGKAKEEPSRKFECVFPSISDLENVLISTTSWAAAKAAKLAGPVAHGSKEVPDGAPDALAGLSFVFTGELSSFSRDEAVDLAKRFGGFAYFLLGNSLPD